MYVYRSQGFIFRTEDQKLRLVCYQSIYSSGLPIDSVIQSYNWRTFKELQQ